MNIHFVCRGNILRSLIADAYLKSLALDNVTVTSSGTVADEYREINKSFFESTKKLLDRHGIGQFGKDVTEQLNQEKLDNQDLVVLMNQTVSSEALPIVKLPENTVYWDITDIGEGDRIAADNNRQEYEEIIFKEITDKVDGLIVDYNLK